MIALHLAPSYSPKGEVKVVNLKTITVQLAAKNKLTPPPSKLTPEKPKVEKTELKKELKPTPKNEQVITKKPEKKETEKKKKPPMTSPPSLAPSTSKKQKADEELAEFGGDRRKGSLKGSTEGITKENKAKSAKTEKITKPVETAPSTQPATPEQTDLASLNKTKPASSQPTVSENINHESDRHLKTENKPGPHPKQIVDSTKVQPERPLVNTSSPSSSKLKSSSAPLKRQTQHKGKIKIAQEASGKAKPSSKSNPLFDAINQAKPAQQLTQQQIGNLKQLGETGLNQARLGDPFSSFEKKQRRVFNQFLAIMSEQVNEHWQQPESDEWLLTRIRLYLTLEGYIKDVYIEESSGNRVFDEQALKAVKAVQQFHMPDSLAAAGYLTRLTMTIDNYSEPEE